MSEFTHYGHEAKKDLDNCSACALTYPQWIDDSPTDRRMGINYAAWPLSYMRHNYLIPDNFLGYLLEELESDNLAYVANLRKHLRKHGYSITGIRKIVATRRKK